MCVYIYSNVCNETNNGVFENKNGWVSNYSLYKIGFVHEIFVRMIIYDYNFFSWGNDEEMVFRPIFTIIYLKPNT